MTTTNVLSPGSDTYSSQGENSRQHSALLQPLARPAWLPEKLWPFQSYGLKVDGATIAVTDVGHGPALLFVHTGFWSFIWRDVILRLANNYHCICLDAPGTGQSDRVVQRDIKLENSSRAVAAVVEALDLQDFIPVVHDLGGPAGLAGLARTPKRIRGIIAVNSFAWRPSGALFRGMLALMGSAPMREFDVLTEFLPRITQRPYGVGRHMDATNRRVFRAGIGSQGVRSFHGYMRDAHKCDDLYTKVESALDGPFRKLPLLTIFGEYNDPLKFQPEWKRRFPSAKQVIVPKGNHFPMCDNPDLVAQTIREWLSERN